mmetsp:Transcript_28660/g.39337  ORF Transcript_28660/g.39337 Transcript_28660/m.39337 type:complete len:355 (+) Transcript_28660:52-1116(+)
MPLSQEFLQYLADASIPEEEYHSLTPVERSSILKDFRLSTATSGIVGEEIEKAMMSTLEKYEAKKESKTITFSSVSEGQVSTYLASINLLILEGGPLDAEENSTISFLPFEWQDIEERDTPRAINHLQRELQKFGVIFGRGNYQMYDVHSKHTFLNVRDDKTGSLSGGTDLIIAPFGMTSGCVKLNSCVAFEFKTKETVDEQGLESFLSQATMELIASNYHSQQMTLVVLTDLCTNSCVLLTFTRESNKLAILQYSDVTLNQMAIFVHSHLQQNCFTIRNYSLPNVDDNIRESEMVMKEWKRARVSGFTSSLQWEHFQEMMEDAPLGSKERAMVIREHFRNRDLPDTSYLSMFS